MERENAPLEMEKHVQTTQFLGSMFIFRGVVVLSTGLVVFYLYEYH